MKKIDPEKFETQGRPTMAQVRAVWEQMPEPAARQCADQLRRRGFEISWRTVARYAAQGWQRPVPNQIRRAVVVPTPPEHPHPPEDPFLVRRRELMNLNEQTLRETESRARIAFNIMLMEAMALKVDVLTLMPGDVAKVIVSMTDAAGAQRSDGKMVESQPALLPPMHGQTAQPMRDITPERTDLQNKITEFKRKVGVS